MDNDDKIVEYLARMFAIIILGIIVAVILGMCSSCTRTVYVPVKEVQTVFQNHTDTVHRTDSIIRETERIVMQLDSQAMAEYGIRLSNAEKAWLVREKQLESKINKLLEKKADTVIVRDTVPQPYAVEKPLSTMQKAWIKVGKICTTLFVGAIIALIAYLITRKH